MNNFLFHVKCIFNIAKTNFFEMLKQPVYYLLAAGAAVLIFFSKDFTMFTFDWGAGDDPSYLRTMVREMGLATMFMASLFMAIMASSKSIYDEIEHKTALSLLSKPLSRGDFIVGKYAGIVLGIVPLICFLGGVLFVTILVQSAQDVEIGLGEEHVVDFSIWKGVYLHFLKAAVLTAFSVAVSTKLPFLPNVLAVTTLFVFGHLSNYLYGFIRNSSGVIYYVGTFFYGIFLNLENYNYFYQGDPPPLPSGALIGLVTLYSVIYISIFMIAAHMLFEKRDLF